jgi:hypothetical protein
LAKCSHLWPSSSLSCSPLPTSHSRIVPSSDTLTRSFASVGRTAQLYATDAIAAILPNVRFLVNFSTPLPR